MEYKISKLPPPCYGEARKRFPVSFDHGVVFTYGDTIHLKHPERLTPDLIVHECTHIKQQAEFKGGPAAWWTEYLNNRGFRQRQEVEAYRAQYGYALQNFNSKHRKHCLMFYAKSLATIYDLGIGENEAIALIIGA